MERALIITGMHRSGTSLVASLLQRFGVDIGENLLGPGEGNPRGHFEDLDFVRFHEDWLHRSGQRMLLQNDFRPRVSSEERDRARRLIDSRQGQGLWGFKDPRTSLFLPFWHELLPEARYLLVFRHPIDVVLSLLRRGSDYEALVDPAAGLRSWAVHNRCILEFYRQHSEHCFLVEIDSLTRNIDRFSSELSRKLGLEIDGADDASELFVRGELRSFSGASGLKSLLRRLMPEVIELLEQLREASDLAGAEDLLPGPAPDLGAVEDLAARIGEKLDSAELSTAMVPALLATLDPAAVQHRRQRLEAFVGHQQQAERLLSLRDEEIVRLVDHAANLEALRAGGDEQVNALAGHAQNLEKLLANRDAGLEALKTHCKNLESLREKDSEHLLLLEKHGRNLESTLEEKETALQDLVVHSSNLEDLWRLARADAEELARGLGVMSADLAEVERQCRGLYTEEEGEGIPARAECKEEPGEPTANPDRPFLARELDVVHDLRRRMRTSRDVLATGFQRLERVEGLERRVAALEVSLRKAEEAVSEYRTHSESLERSLVSSKDELASVRAHSDNLATELVSTRAHAKNLEGEAVRLEAVLEGHRLHIANLERERQRSLAMLTELRSHADAGQAEIERLEEHARELVSHSENLQREIEVGERQRRELERHGENLEETLQRERSLVQDLKAHAENLQRDLMEARQSLELIVANGEKVEASREKAEKDLAAVSAELGRTKNELDEWREQARARGDESERLVAKVARLETEVERKGEELGRRQELLAERHLEIQQLTNTLRRADQNLQQLNSSLWIRLLRRVTLLPEKSPAENR